MMGDQRGIIRPFRTCNCRPRRRLGGGVGRVATLGTDGHLADLRLPDARMAETNEARGQIKGPLIRLIEAQYTSGLRSVDC